MLNFRARTTIHFVCGCLTTILFIYMCGWLHKPCGSRLRVPTRRNFSKTTLKPTVLPTTRLPSGRCANALPRLEEGVKKTKRGIPLILHQIYKDTSVPQEYIPFMKSCRRVNKDFVHILWTDADFDKFLKWKRPDLVGLSKNYKDPAQQSDFMRLVILEQYGGVYLDLDVECRTPLTETLDKLDATCIVDRERELQSKLIWKRAPIAMNSAIMTTPKHPFIVFMLNELPKHLKNALVHYRTGPIFMTNCYEEYSRKTPSGPGAVFMAPSRLFSPLLDRSVLKVFDAKCSDPLNANIKIMQEACKEWKAQGQMQNEQEEKKNSPIVHHFFHFIYSFAKNLIKTRLNACKELPDLLVFTK